MADVLGQFYSGSKGRSGTTPESPSDIEGVQPFPVNPPGSSNAYLSLTDTFDSNYIGKNGFVPVVTGEGGLTLQPLPQIQENGLVSGGIVQWTGSGYIFNISSAFYRIGGTAYSTLATTKTLSTPDPTNNRIDVFAVNSSGAVVVIEGTPSATPVKPQIDPSIELELTSVIVTAATTQPILTDEVIYDENTEWTGSSSGTGTANFASAVDPFQGAVSIETTDIQNGFQIVLDNGADFDLGTVQTLGMQLRLKDDLNSNQNIYITFLDSADLAISPFILLPINKGITTYQFIGLVLSGISFTSNLLRKIRFSFVRSGGSPTFSGYFLDIIKLEGGINPPLTVGSFLSLSDTPATYSGQAGKSVAVKADESGLEFVDGGSGGGGLGAEPIQEKFTYVSPDPQTFVVAGSPNGRPDLYMNGQFIDFTFWTWDVGTKTATITGITLVDGAKIVLAYYANISGTYAWDGITLNGNTIGGVKRLIEIGDILIIPLYWQYIVTSLDVDGIIINEGEIIIG